MNTDNYEMTNNAIIITRKFIYMMYIIYIFIYAINYKSVNAYFNKKVEKVENLVKTLVNVDEAETLEETVLSEEETLEETVLSEAETLEETVLSEEDTLEDEVLTLIHPVEDVNTWYDVEDGKAKYKGEWKNGLPNGKGIKIIHEKESIIDGNFVDGFAEGYGRQVFAKSWEKMVPYYEGEFKRNHYHGKGEYHYGTGRYYKGMWKNSKQHGQGAEYVHHIDRTWVGEYYNDKKVNGDWYHGEL
jgi:hypothetical protein